MDHLKLTVDKLSVDEVSDLVVDDSCGAVSIFVGTTRDNFEGKKVLRLEYEAYEPMALKAMKAICDEVRSKWSAVHGIAIYHRLGNVPCREASVVIAVSSPHRHASLEAVAHCIERLKASVPVWKREVYDGQGEAPVWKENKEWNLSAPPDVSLTSSAPPTGASEEQFFGLCRRPWFYCGSHHYGPIPPIDKNLVQINVSNEELQQRIQNFIERKRERVNISNIHDFIPGTRESETEDEETCARVRTQFVRRSDSKGHLKIRKVHNEWGPQTVHTHEEPKHTAANPAWGLPAAIAERVLAVERYLNTGPVAPDIYRRLKAMEDRIAQLQAVSPEYAHFWKNNKEADEVKQEPTADYTFSADDIARKIELLEKQQSSD